MEFIFGVFDNDENRRLDFLREEERRIDAAFRKLKAQHRDLIDKEIVYNLGFDQFKNYLTEFANKMTIFHFSGHHEEGQTQLTDQVVQDEGIIDILNNSQSLKLVFLNGCNTKSLVEKLDQVPIIIYTQKAVNDHEAKEIAAKFYELVTQEVYNFTKPTVIEDCFKQAMGFQKLAIAGVDRGEGPAAEIAISEGHQIKVNRGLVNFDLRMFYGFEESLYPANKQYEDFIKDWFEKNAFEERERSYFGSYLYRYFPMPLAHFLKKISPKMDDEAGKQLGSYRFENIQYLFHTKLIFLKYCGFSVLWHYLLEKQASNASETVKKDSELAATLKEKIKEHLGWNWYSYKEGAVNILTERIQFLLALYQAIIDLGIDNLFIREGHTFLQKNEKALSEFCQIFCLDAEKIEGFYLLKAEQYLPFFANKAQFLKEYEMASVQESMFTRYLIEEDKYFYTIRRFPKDVRPKLLNPNKPSSIIYDVYSIILRNKRDALDAPPVLNLSPFFIDKNIGEPGVDEIDMVFLTNYSYTLEQLLYFSLKDERMENPEPWTNEAGNIGTKAKVYEMVKIYEHINELLKIIE